jgi:hypothetical protein
LFGELTLGCDPVADLLFVGFPLLDLVWADIIEELLESSFRELTLASVVQSDLNLATPFSLCFSFAPKSISCSDDSSFKAFFFFCSRTAELLSLSPRNNSKEACSSSEWTSGRMGVVASLPGVA